MSSKACDLDLDVQGQIGLETSKILVLILKKFNLLEFYLKLELFIGHLNVSYDLKLGDLDLDLKGQIGLQTSKIFILTVKH